MLRHTSDEADVNDLDTSHKQAACSDITQCADDTGTAAVGEDTLQLLLSTLTDRPQVKAPDAANSQLPNGSIVYSPDVDPHSKESCTTHPDGDCSEEATLIHWLRQLRLRYFTPREVANLHSFPSSFSFPPHVTSRQQYALLGNSLSVAVVADLLTYLLKTPV